MGFLRQASKRILSSALPRRMLLTEGPRDARAAAPGDARRPRDVALTFDDGPHPERTPELLDRLRERGIAATFFVVGERAARHPEIVRRMIAEGHELGNHTYTHCDAAETPASALIDEVRRCQRLLEDISGAPCTLFRPPRGRLTAPKMLALWRAGQTIVLWNVDPRPIAEGSGERLMAWCERCELGSGDIVLMHDDEPHTAAAAAALAARAASERVAFVPVSRYLADKGRV